MTSEAAEWTIATLKLHFEGMLTERDVRLEQRFLAQEKAVEAALSAAKEAVAAALAAAEKATTIAEINSKEWRLGANEWRGAMTDRERDLFSRREGESLAAQVANLRDRVNTETGGDAGGRRTRDDAARDLGVKIALTAVFISTVAPILTLVLR